jgi:WD40 repeat protein
MAGTEAGDICVFALANKVFRACVPVCKSAVHALEWSAVDQALYVAGGDGKVYRITGSDTRWDVKDMSLILPSHLAVTPSQKSAPVVRTHAFSFSTGAVDPVSGSSSSLAAVVAVASKDDRLVVASANAKIYLIDSHDMSQVSLLRAGHYSPITDIACLDPSSSSRTDEKIFATTMRGSGQLTIWKMSHDHVEMKMLMTGTPRQGTDATCVAMFGAGWPSISQSKPVALVGYADGSMRCWPLEPSTYSVSILSAVWVISSAHRGGVSCIAASTAAIATGGASDGIVRIWHPETRELVSQFCEHKKVCKFFVDDVFFIVGFENSF